MVKVQKRWQARAAQQEAGQQPGKKAEKGTGPRGSPSHQGQAARPVEAAVRPVDQRGGAASHLPEIRGGAVPLAGGAISEGLGLHPAEAHQESLRAKAGRGEKMVGGRVSRDQGAGRKGRGGHLFRRRDRLQEHPPSGQELCAKRQDAHHHGNGQALHGKHDIGHQQQGPPTVHAHGIHVQQRGVQEVPRTDDKIQQEESVLRYGQPPFPQDQEAQPMDRGQQGQNRGFLHPAIFPRAKPAGICEPRPEDQRCRQEKAYQQRAAQGEHLRFHEQKEEGQTASEKIFPSRARPVRRIRVLYELID